MLVTGNVSSTGSVIATTQNTVISTVALGISSEPISIPAAADMSHRTVAATVVLWLERLKLGRTLPAIAVAEPSRSEPTLPRVQAGRAADV